MRVVIGQPGGRARMLLITTDPTLATLQLSSGEVSVPVPPSIPERPMNSSIDYTISESLQLTDMIAP